MASSPSPPGGQPNAESPQSGAGKGKGAAARSGPSDGTGSRPGTQPPNTARGSDRKARPQPRKLADRLRPSGEEALARGIRQLEGMAQARRLGHPPTREQESRLREEAYSHLDEGVRGSYGYNENTRPILSAVQKALKDPAQAVDERLVADLLAQLRRLRRETSDADAADAVSAEPISVIDPAQLPPAYRSSIQRYFEKLSKTQ